MGLRYWDEGWTRAQSEAEMDRWNDNPQPDPPTPDEYMDPQPQWQKDMVVREIVPAEPAPTTELESDGS